MSHSDDPVKLTPMMEQWHRCKNKAKDAILLFRLGDFYEAFYEDAKVISEALEITLTQRGGIPMSGIPWHTCESYIDRLVEKGYRIAIAEQTEEAKNGKGLVNREIVRFITPGTIIHSELIRNKSYNFVIALTQVGATFGLAVSDITTSLCKTVEIESFHETMNELYRLAPAEIVVTKKIQDKHPSLASEFKHVSFTTLEDWRFDHQTAYSFLKKHLQVPHLDCFGLKGMVAAVNACGALLAYLQEDLSLSIEHIQEIKPYSIHESLLIDKTCQINLELIQPLFDRSRNSTLLHVIDHTLTPMGGRMIQQWLKNPLLDIKKIQSRQDSIEALLSLPEIRTNLQNEFKQVRDLERLMMKVCAGLASPRDLVSFRLSLEKIGPIKELLRPFSSELLLQCSEELIEIPQLTNELKRALDDEPPARIFDGNIFRAGYHPDLDALRDIVKGSKDWLARYQTTLKESSGIKNLKVSYNKVFGYYIEVSKGQAHLMPPSFERRQTLVNCERFISSDLKEYETKVLTAEERAYHLEQSLFIELRNQVASYEKTIFPMSRALAEIDALLSLAQVAQQSKYHRPLVDLSHQLSIVEGRHPVIEAAIEKGSFIPNDTHLDPEERMMLITGPNMAGKSTYIRQVALIVILAQMGSFVPAKTAHIGIIDRIFSRIGANDDLSRGQSTFMVEMSETANILNNLTPRSLIILDEIGRGTSTYDGVSIAWAVAENLVSSQAKALFATHYWELTELEKTLPGAVNYHASVQEWNDTIIFLHKILKGGTDRSYGIHVARLAGLPLSVIHRASSILSRLEAKKETSRRSKKGSTENQLTLF